MADKYTSIKNVLLSIFSQIVNDLDIQFKEKIGVSILFKLLKIALNNELIFFAAKRRQDASGRRTSVKAFNFRELQFQNLPFKISLNLPLRKTD